MLLWDGVDFVIRDFRDGEHLGRGTVYEYQGKSGFNAYYSKHYISPGLLHFQLAKNIRICSIIVKLNLSTDSTLKTHGYCHHKTTITLIADQVRLSPLGALDGGRMDSTQPGD